MTNVKKFLKEGEAEWYHEVNITFVKGKPPLLTIYEDVLGQHKEKETINLSNYDDKGLEGLHQLMVDKGFKRKDEEEIKNLKETFQAEKLAKELETQRRIEAFRKKVGVDENYKPPIKSQVVAINGKEIKAKEVSTETSVKNDKAATNEQVEKERVHDEL